MKRRITLSIALFLSIALVSLMSSDSTVKAQQGIKPVADTGIVTLGPNQILRITVAAKFGASDVNVRFRQIEYFRRCNSPMCGGFQAAQNTTPTTTVLPGDGVWLDINPDTNKDVRGVVFSNRRDVRVTGLIINSMTGEVDAFMDYTDDEGIDF